MNFWLCSNCGKKVAETLKACPYCKALKQQELKVISSDTKYLKMIIVLLGCIITGGTIFYFASNNKPTESTQQNHVINATPQNPQQKKSTKIPQSAVVAYQALKKVEARTEVGVSRRDYPEVITDAKVAVNLFLESPDSQSVPDLKQSLEYVMKRYTFAQDVWDLSSDFDHTTQWKRASEELKKASVIMGNIP